MHEGVVSHDRALYEGWNVQLKQVLYVMNPSKVQFHGSEHHSESMFGNTFDTPVIDSRSRHFTGAVMVIVVTASRM